MEYGILSTEKYLTQMFDSIRIVDPLRSEVIDLPSKKVPKEHRCYEFWKSKEVCTNCISTRAYQEGQTVVKIEYNEERLYWVMAAPIEEDGRRYVIETLRDITHACIVENVEKKTVKELKEEIAHRNALVVTDELTGCFNRRYIKERLEIDITKSLEKQKNLVLTLIDIDHFKKINDTYGHLMGDYILKEMGAFFREELAETINWIARYGGEEFILVSYNQPIEEVAKKIEEIRIRLNKHLFRFEEHKVLISISAGMAQVSEQVDQLEKLIEQADSYLYKAKEKGRNQVIF